MPVIDKQTEEYQSEMQEIIGTPPPWLIQWGMSVIFFIILMILGISVLIRYPDTVKTPLRIQSDNAPQVVKAQISGKVQKLLVNDGQEVDQGDILAYVLTTGNHEVILKSLKQLKEMRTEMLAGKHRSRLSFQPEMQELGELQSSFESFYTEYYSYQALYPNQDLQNEVSLVNIEKHKTKLSNQVQEQEKVVEARTKELEKHQLLSDQKPDSKVDLQREEIKLIYAQQALDRAKAYLMTTEATYATMVSENLEGQSLHQKAKASLLQKLNALISEFENWKRMYVLSAPGGGRISFARTLRESGFIRANEEMFHINGSKAPKYFGLIEIPQSEIAKIKTGQDVLIKLRSFPFQEYGLIRGKISSMAELPMRDSVFLSTISFNLANQQLSRPIELKAGLIGDAEIITREASLFSRIMKELIKVIE